ncbi:hypothetical protein WS67_12085 [Burkholderia singularis]|uniref:Uncharacterized protein n=1 Tax=Burkholderia singularis TaxID=1503053 RepID=A0A103E308_9BURK|nr:MULTISPECIES: hypothetical protein [Burkholderia]KVE27235.1 hypothetical protein WS67_12085 [Burkholderia singularis]KVE33729.1 hypothetical protein WS68_11180 [Burkholderia sp. TSV86]
MSLESAIQENTAAVRELIAALLSLGALQTAQASATAHASPAVQAVVAAQKNLAEREAEKGKKPKTDTAATATADDAVTTESKLSGEPSAPIPESFSPEQKTAALKPWHKKTAALYAELKDAEPTLEACKRAIIGVSTHVGRAQAVALLARFGAQVVSPKPGQKHLDESLFGEYMALAREVLAGRVDPTESIPQE